MGDKDVLLPKNQMVGITELQRNSSAVTAKAKEKDILVLKNNVPFVVIMDYERYEVLLEKVEQAGIHAMIEEGRKDPDFYSTKQVFAGLSFADSGGTEVYGESAEAPTEESRTFRTVRSKGSCGTLRRKAPVAR